MNSDILNSKKKKGIFMRQHGERNPVEQWYFENRHRVLTLFLNLLAYYESKILSAHSLG